MSDIYFTTNPAEFTKLEGLYVSERKPPGFIRGADLSTTGMAGRCVRGPTTPTEINSTARFLEVYGGRDYTANGAGGALVGQVWAALVNKPFGKLVVRRVVAADAVVASFTLETAAGGGGTAVLRVDASSAGLWGNDVQVKISAATDGNVNHFNMTVRYLGQEVTYTNLDISGTNDNTAVTIGSDEARLVTLTKLAAGRPVNTAAATDGADAEAFVNLGEAVAAFTSVAGSDGALAVTDYNAGVNDLAIYPGVGVVLVPEAVVGSAATFHSNLVTQAALVADRVFLTWAQAHGQTVNAEAAQIAAQVTTRTDRIWWAYNSAYTVDPLTGGEIQQGPHVWLASILSQIDIDIHPGAIETIAHLAGVKRLTNTSLSRTDLVTLRNAGISTLERTVDGFQFRSVVTSDLTPGKTEATRRRMTDFLQLSASSRLRSFVKAKNTAATRAAMAAELTAFSQQLRAQERVIAEFSIDQVSVNTTQQRGQGLEKLLWRVKLVDHILYLVFETEIATGLTIEQQAA